MDQPPECTTHQRKILLTALMDQILEMEESQTRLDQEAMHTILASSRLSSIPTQDDVVEGRSKQRAASKDCMSRLPKARILPCDKERNKHDSRVCGVCCGRLIDGIILMRLPCGHVYHINCLVPWFEQANSCPECRYEIPTANQVYETERQKRMANRTTVSCTCNPCLHHHTCFFDDSKLVVQAGKKK